LSVLDGNDEIFTDVLSNWAISEGIILVAFAPIDALCSILSLDAVLSQNISHLLLGLDQPLSCATESLN